MRRAVTAFILFMMIMLSTAAIGEGVDDPADSAITSALLDIMGQDVLFDRSNEYEEIFTVGHCILDENKQDAVYEVWLAASPLVSQIASGVLQNELVYYGVEYYYLKFAIRPDGYALVDFSTPLPGSFAPDMRAFFPKKMHGIMNDDEAFRGERNRAARIAAEKAYEHAVAYCENWRTDYQNEESPWRIPLQPAHWSDPAHRAVNRSIRFAPQWEGKVYLMVSNTEKSYITLSVEGEHSYYGNLTFAKYDLLTEEQLWHVTVKYENDELIVLSGALPPLEW